jgi:hypothetical protein
MYGAHAMRCTTALPCPALTRARCCLPTARRGIPHPAQVLSGREPPAHAACMRGCPDRRHARQTRPPRDGRGQGAAPGARSVGPAAGQHAGRAVPRPAGIVCRRAPGLRQAVGPRATTTPVCASPAAMGPDGSGFIHIMGNATTPGPSRRRYLPCRPSPCSTLQRCAMRRRPRPLRARRHPRSLPSTASPGMFTSPMLLAARRLAIDSLNRMCAHCSPKSSGWTQAAASPTHSYSR